MNHLNEVIHYNKSFKQTDSLKWINFVILHGYYSS